MNDIMIFYLIVAISLLIVTILVYPSLQERERSKNRR